MLHLMRSPAASPPIPCSILGVTVWSCDHDTACDLIESRIVEHRPTKIAFLNANLALLTIDQQGLRETLRDFVVLNDGLGVEIANRLLNGRAFPANLNGTDLVPYFLTRCRSSLRLFLLGARPAALEQAVLAAQRRWPRHSIVGHAHGYFAPEQETAILQSIAAARPDLVLVAMGNPQQELWIARNIPSCASCGIGVGALFDFMGGVVPRAPDWVRAARSEWLYRLAREPGRLWHRYLVGNPRFLGHVLASRAARPFATHHARRSAG